MDKKLSNEDIKTQRWECEMSKWRKVVSCYLIEVAGKSTFITCDGNFEDTSRCSVNGS